MKKVQKNKLHFEKPNIAGAQFVACNAIMVTTFMPEYTGLAAMCELPVIAVEAPVAVLQ